MRFIPVAILLYGLISAASANQGCEVGSTVDSEFLQDMKSVSAKVQDTKDWISCLEEFEKHPLVPNTAVSQFWHKLGKKKVFAARCKYLDQDAAKEKIFTFLTDEGFSSVNFPAFAVRVPSRLGGSETSRFPREQMKFTHNGTSYYISEHNKVGDDIDLLTKPIASTQSFITKYESLLESNKLSKEIKLKPAQDLEGAKSCVTYQMNRYLKLVVEDTPMKNLPPDAEIKEDLGKAKWLPELKEKYLRKTADVRNEFIEIVLKSLPSCQGVLVQEDLENLVETVYGQRLNQYESMRATVHQD